MANRVVIDVETRYRDGVSAQLSTVSKNADKAKKSVEGATKAVDKLGKTKAEVKLTAKDNASSKLSKVLGAAKSFGTKTFKGTLGFNDKASKVLRNVSDAANKLTVKPFKATISLIDNATSPLRKIYNSIFNIKNLIAGIFAGAAIRQITSVGIMNPINLADAYTGAKIGFSTLLGEAEANAMMNQIDAFAKATPFKTSNTISSIQKMMAYGWDASRVIEDMKVIGDAAAATGKGDQGLESIVYALSEIRSKGKLSTQELNQLASAGIKAKAYLAEGLGFGTSDAGMAKLSKALEDGKVGANQSIELILEGMKEFDGMMDKTANETVGGLKSQLEDVFEINIARRWGQGLQDGAKKGLGSIVELLNTAEDSLENFGDMVYDVGHELSNWAAGKFDKVVTTINDIASTDMFKEASLGKKANMLWQALVSDPLAEWWENGGQERTAETAGKIGNWIGTTMSDAILSILGVTDLLDEEFDTSAGMSVAQSFSKGFADGFDADLISDKLAEAIDKVWDKLPTWAKWAFGIYAGGKVAGGVSSALGGIASLVGGTASIIGSAGAGTGILGTGALTAIGLGAGNLAGGASLSVGALSAIGLGAIAGGVVGAGSIGKGAYDLYGSYKAYKAGDEVEGKAKAVSGTSALTGVATGAMLGSLFGPAGTLIGAGIGGAVGWWRGSEWAKDIRKETEAAKYESEAMQKAIKEAELSAEQLRLEFERAVNSNIKDHFGDIKLTMEEIQSIAKRTLLGDKNEGLSAFVKATETAAASVKTIQTAADALDRANWKVGLGLNLDEAEIEEFSTAIESYIASAEKYVEDKHYEFTAAVNLLIDTSNGDGKTVLNGGNSFYSQLKEQIEGLGNQLSKSVNIALKDGVITLDEQSEIVNLQNQIAEITNKLTQAETEAEFETIKIKFGKSNISSESFLQLQEELQNQLTESSASYEDALTVGLTNLRLQYNEGLIKEDEYERLKGALEDSFNSQMEELELKVQNVQLDIIGGAYQDVLGEDGAAKLRNAIQTSINQGLNPIDWSTDDVRRFLGINSLSEEASAAIISLLSSMEFDTSPTVNLEPQYNLLKQWSPLSSAFNRTIYPTVTVSPSYVDTKGAPYKQNANGSIINSKTLSWVGEEGPEAIIPLVPGRRSRGLKLWEEAGKRLGVKYHANGGIIGGGAPVQLGGDGGGQKVEINMGGVTIEIKTDANKSMVQNIEEQEEEIAKKVAEIFKNVFSAQFANRPAKGGA
ncbi:MAG: tape measure protein [Bacteroidaceae bacterium]|nr:tape measure protein [Bacteroidaceae bacterium]